MTGLPSWPLATTPVGCAVAVVGSLGDGEDSGVPDPEQPASVIPAAMATVVAETIRARVLIK